MSSGVREVVQWGKWLGARADVFAVALPHGVKTQRTEFSATPMTDLENSHSFSFRNDIPHGQCDLPSKNPLVCECEDTSFLRYTYSYLQVQIPESLNLQISNYRRISLFLFNELLLLPRQMFFSCPVTLV